MTDEEFKLIVTTIRDGFTTADGVHVRPAPVVSAAILTQGNTGLRCGDVLRLKISDFVYERGKYRFNNFVEQKTGKVRNLPIATEFFTYLQSYAIENGIGKDERLFPISVRTVQHHLKQVSDYLGLTGISSHSARKYMATKIYQSSKDPEVVRSVLLHSSITVSQNYISLAPEAVDRALQNHCSIPT